MTYTFEITPKLDNRTEVKILDGGTDCEWTTCANDKVGEVVNKFIASRANKAARKIWREQFEGLRPVQILDHEEFSHYRVKTYGVLFYVKSPYSPTGVENVNGVSLEVWNSMSIRHL